MRTKKWKQFIGAHAVLLHFLSTPALAAQLKTLHDLALYDSGDALLGQEEKEALLSVRQLTNKLERLSNAEIRLLRRLL